jgi:nucleotide-binding universal stress UspA family protein
MTVTDARRATTYGHVVVGTDGSATAERAVAAAATLAAAIDADLTVATAWYRDMPDKPVLSELVSEYPTGDAGAMEASWAEMTVSDGAAIARKTSVDEPEVATPQGHPADALLDVAQAQPDGTLLAVGTAGLGSRTERLLGNVPHQITHHARTDVLLVRSDAEDRAPYGRVVLATDGSDTAAIAVGRGLALAQALGATPVLLTAAADERRGEAVLDAVAVTLDDGHGIDRHVAVGRDTATTIAEAVAARDLLVIGNKGMSGPSRLLGSVANRITHLVPTDLLLCNTARR